ncbi:hypothetical protein GDO81_001742 [Engystomops pustulosus]|uniref:Uncharacterized protein n=1 Tax=Engystomops pustulosus TaxID=76066 RepID=A0AAV7DF86_ENGPU|nr:hypothetical protein GDO81_001742 [Engystomops pustulosus]
MTARVTDLHRVWVSRYPRHTQRPGLKTLLQTTDFRHQQAVQEELTSQLILQMYLIFYCLKFKSHIL